MCRLLGYGGEHKEVPSLGEILGVQAAGGVVAGATASCITTPLDTIKTRLQVQVTSASFLCANLFSYEMHLWFTCILFIQIHASLPSFSIL